MCVRQWACCLLCAQLWLFLTYLPIRYLEILVSKIASVSPDLVLVERTVSRLALDFLLAENISVVLNIKPGLMPRVRKQCVRVSGCCAVCCV